MKRSEMKNGILILILALIQTIAFGQTKSEKKELADEYLKRENYQKALDNYEDLAGDEAWDPLIFKNYITCLDKLKPSKSESVIKKYLKRYPQEMMYQTFQFTWLKNVKKDEKDFQKYTRSKLIPWFLQTSERTRFGYSFFLQNQNPEFAAVILDEGIKQFGLSAMWKEVFQAQLAEKKYPQLSQTIMQLLDQKVLDENELEAYLQEHIAIDELARLMQIELLKSIQLKPSAIVYPSFLGWIYVQKKDFEGALIQYRALDLLQNTGGTRCYQLGEFAVNNDLIPLAIKSFEFVINSFPASQYRFLAQQKIVQLREDRVRNTYPVK
ncbi:MAG TPA: hypothetical protein PK509_00120, partial [Catalimonadaceae bacterium]|nr:hypothetical protein [Catalimonadaceae bacterium]